MKIKERPLSYDQVMALPREDRGKPRRPAPFFRLLLKTLSGADLKATHFQCRTEGMERLGKGVTLTCKSCGGALDYRQGPTASYSLYSDYFWYELGDMICIGDSHTLYYCFPQEGGDIVAKTRLATEELYKMQT